MPKPIFMTNRVATTAILPLEVALYRACKDRHGSMSAIAETHGFSRDHFINQLDPNKTNCHVHPEAIGAITGYTKDPRILDSMCAAHGNAAWFELPDMDALARHDFMFDLGATCNEVGHLSKTVCESLYDDRITELEAAQIEKDCMNLIRAVLHLRAMAKAKAGE